MKTNKTATSPDEYLAGLEAGPREKIELLRSLIRDVVPEATEGIRYRMLCYDHGGELFAVGAQKHHVSLYVMATQAMVDHAEDLRGIDHGKGCLRFRAKDTIPVEVIRALLETAKESSERACRPVEQ